MTMPMARGSDDWNELLDHGGDLRPRWWQRPSVPAEWTACLSDLPLSARGRGYRRITRRDLLTHAHDRTIASSGQLLVKCYAWGTGDSGWLVGRRARVFRDTPSEVLGNRLLRARHILDAEGAAAAYSALNDGGALRTKHMRASFFTKFLYAADASDDGACGRALILDQYVAIALNDRHQWGLWKTGPWTTETYQCWLDHAHEQARRDSQRTGSVVRADAVEKDYFLYGQRLARERRALLRRRPRQPGGVAGAAPAASC